MTTTWTLIGRLTRKPIVHAGKRFWAEAVFQHDLEGSPSPVRLTAFDDAAERLASCEAGQVVEVTGASRWSLVITDVHPVEVDE